MTESYAHIHRIELAPRIDQQPYFRNVNVSEGVVVAAKDYRELSFISLTVVARRRKQSIQVWSRQLAVSAAVTGSSGLEMLELQFSIEEPTGQDLAIVDQLDLEILDAAGATVKTETFGPAPLSSGDSVSIPVDDIAAGAYQAVVTATYADDPSTFAATALGTLSAAFVKP